MKPSRSRVNPGASVIGGTVVLDGRLIVEAAAVGADTQFAGMVRLVEEAQAQKADAQRFADRIAAVFVPVRLRHRRADRGRMAAGRGRTPTARSPPRWPCWSSPARAHWGWPPRPP